MLVKSIKVGNLILKNNILLAPMAGITDRPFRILCKEQGAALSFTEMVSAKALFYHDSKTKLLLNHKEEPGPIGVQIFGSDIEAMRYAASYVSEFADIIDINMGCPAPKIVKNGDGSKLLLDLPLAQKIIEAVVQNTDKPVSVKIRKGWDQEHIVAMEAAKRIEQAGASMITIHGRTRSEFYSGHADWDMIRKVKESVSIPVIGNGDVVDGKTARKMLEETKVDGIMCGRATMGNPWLFSEILSYLKTGKEKKPTQKERKEMILRHIEMEVEEKTELVAIKEMRKQISWYLKGLKEATKMREKINQITTKQEMIQALTEYFQTI